MPAYDAAGFSPPAPVALVDLRDQDTGAICPGVPMLIDTGADVTLVPRTAVDALGTGVSEGTFYELAGFDATRSLAPVVRLDLLFLRRTFRGQFLVVDQACGVLGRNVLNAIPLLLDGPRLAWEEHRAP